MNLYNKLSEHLPVLEDPIIQNTITTVLIVIVLWLLGKLLDKVITRRIVDVKSRYRWRKTISYTMVFLGAILIGQTWFKGVETLATYLGLVSAGIAIALRDPLTNLVGWLFLLWRKPFNVGDRIQIGENRGDVIDIRAFQFTILEIGNWVHADQSTGRMIHIPNFQIFTLPLSNYSTGFNYIWNEIPILLTFESDWKKAKKILLDIVQKHTINITPQVQKEIQQAAKQFMIIYHVLTPTVYTSVEDSGVLLTIRYISAVRNRRGSEEKIWEAVLDAFSGEKDIDFAYPTTRFYNNRTEGKQAPPDLQ